MNQERNMQNLKDVSRFTRWVNLLDEKDKTLNPLKRKSKWAMIVAFLFALFAISFIWFPAGSPKAHQLETPMVEPISEVQVAKGLSVFEMPVDSFANRLKLSVDEKTIEEK